MPGVLDDWTPGRQTSDALGSGLYQLISWVAGRLALMLGVHKPRKGTTAMAPQEDLPFMWGHVPEDDHPDERHIDLRRVGAGESVSGICLSRDLIGTYVHYAGKTTPCRKADCYGCTAGLRRGFETYIALLMSQPTKVYIYALSDNASRELDRYWKIHRSLRGKRVVLSRKGEARNGKLSAWCKDPGVDPSTIPNEPDVFGIMLRIWGLTQLALPIFSNHPTNHETKPTARARSARGKSDPAKIDAASALNRINGRGEVS
jgi:hypothetical protein